jgi:hypothetical protein
MNHLHHRNDEFARQIENLSIIVPMVRRNAKSLAERHNETLPPGAEPIRWEDLLLEDANGVQQRALEMINDIRKSGLWRPDR